ncbi:MAG TPA: SgcJ/EcaC family oxidoreductase [Pyrinomonadaceae bacterium]|nr:SgcJ/EcaC family oxidoreductase [Pyrinomonadaceae bacterium]
MRSNTRVRNISLALFALLACAPDAPAQTRAGGGDEAALRENVRQLEAGWNSKSGAAFAMPFAEDADYVVINGMQIKGREAITQGHQRIFDTVYKDSVISLSVKQARMLRADVAVVHVSAHLKSTPAAGAQEGDAVITLVMTKEGGAWKIVAFQNTGVAAGRN